MEIEKEKSFVSMGVGWVSERKELNQSVWGVGRVGKDIILNQD